MKYFNTKLTMKHILIVSLISIVSSSPIYNDGQSVFRHREDIIEHKIPRNDRPHRNEVNNQWLEKFYQMKMPQFNQDVDLSEAPEEFLMLLKNMLDQKPPVDEDDRYPSATMDQNMEPLAYASRFNNEDDNSADTADYRDYNLPPNLLDSAQLNDEFQQALAEYLIQQRAEQMKNSNKPDVSKGKEAQAEDKTTETPSNIASPTTSILSAPIKMTAETLSPADDVSASNKLSVIPPVSVGKGQKEFPMLRPASDNNRKFDNWAQNLETSMTAKILQKAPSFQRIPTDSLTEELNQLKLQSKREVKKSQSLTH